MNYEGVKQSEKVILMKVTSRGRPETLKQTVIKYKTLASNPHKMLWVFTFDADDKSITNRYLAELHTLIPTAIFDFIPPSNKITAINSSVPIKGWDILLNISDDQLPIQNKYDDVIRNAMPDHLDSSLWFSDGHQMRINTQEILGYKYYKRLNYIYNPLYKSFFCDNESTQVALNLNKIIKSHKCIIQHFHPGWNKNSHIKNDSLYLHNNKFWKEDELTFKKRQLNGFL
jgi:hypothetical protein